ncbi:hypothetical protein [Azohydromonas caseinilytica]|uniref:Lysozyme inhibitor LprI N-terminal domain-containing protein n=1 Tax=Azohydromonas caseinilytica TaxID=2728836 RepID=A0A848FCV7_9BURK|nr:hypothetical protein [Azohydromonas caseinilytica]NML16816.1 hypothetical protein [Azohydromonas caseinilytica]
MVLKLSHLGAALLLAWAVGASAADIEPARCVAVLKLHSNDLAEQVKDGNAARRPELLQTLRQGAAFIGSAYLHDDLGDEDSAKDRLAAAEDEVRQLDAPQARALRTRCSTQADTLMQQAPGWQRKVVDHFAQARMKKLLQPPH